ncbi:MAG TPA: hypothetical protein VGB42_09255 [Candidatus Thermoplasmatota archaeon]
MTEAGGPPFVQRAIGSAMVTGAAAASVALAVGRPMVREGIRSACGTSSSVRRSYARAAREVGRAAWESSRPLTETALGAKDRARRRAVGMLPPAIGEAVEGWRHDLIEAEKAVYYGSREALSDVQPRVDRACAVGLELVERAFDAWDDIVDASVAAAATVGEDMQRPPPAAGPARSAPRSGHGARKRRR